MEEQKRHSGFEAMRILSMVMIVLMHGIGHGGLGSAAPQGSAAFWIYWLLFILARVSTNCFVMLSGYYLSERKGAVRAGRLFRIGAQVWFYSMLTFCVAVKAGAVPLSAISLLRALLPLTSNGYWFASAYFLMYLSVPVLNAVVQSLDRRQYKTLLLVALLLQSVWGTLFYWATDETFVNNGYSFIWFYTLYFMAAYFRKYRVTVPSGLCLLAYLAASAAGLFNRMLALRVENALHLNGFVNTVNGYQALATVIASAAMFLLFQNIHIRSDYWRRWVFRLAPLSFGVYLLHDSDFTRALLWRLVDLPRFGGALLPSLAYLTCAVLLIAAAGYAVDAVYQRLYRLLHLPALETKLDALTARILQNIVGSKETKRKALSHEFFVRQRFFSSSARPCRTSAAPARPAKRVPGFPAAGRRQAMQWPRSQRRAGYGCHSSGRRSARWADHAGGCRKSRRGRGSPGRTVPRQSHRWWSTGISAASARPRWYCR